MKQLSPLLFSDKALLSLLFLRTKSPDKQVSIGSTAEAMGHEDGKMILP
jgi:hypothetical protein